MYHSRRDQLLREHRLRAGACPGDLEIQGLAHQSTQAGNPVTTPNNVVTAVKHNGFWIQTPESRADVDTSTSNGIFVFTSSSPAVTVGDLVDVTGLVSEYRPGWGRAAAT